MSDLANKCSEDNRNRSKIVHFLLLMTFASHLHLILELGTEYIQDGRDERKLSILRPNNGKLNCFESLQDVFGSSHSWTGSVYNTQRFRATNLN